MADKFAREMRLAREGKGITKYRLAKEARISEGLLSRLESGKQLPADETVAKIAKALDAPYDRLLAAAWADRSGEDAVRNVAAHVSPHTVGLGAQASGKLVEMGSDFVRLPRYGPVACGDPPMFTSTDSVETVDVPARWAAGADAVFRVRGNSLSALRILDGDELLVAKIEGDRPPPGAVVILATEGSYVARVYRRDDLGEWLESHEVGSDPKRHRYPDGTQVVGRALRMMVSL